MTLVSRSLARTAALALAAALALSACSTSEPAAPPTSASSSTTGATSPSPSESTPAPGEWTLDDLKVGAQVPKEDLERLFPKWDKPTPPATLTEKSEQGAKDAAVYFAAVVDYASSVREIEPINSIDSEYCGNCDDVRDAITRSNNEEIWWTEPTIVAESTEIDPNNERITEVKVRLERNTGIVLDTTVSRIDEVSRSSSSPLYFYVSFLDGQWVPVFLNLDSSQL